MGSSVTIVTAIASMAPGYTVYCPPTQSLYQFYITAPLYVVCTQEALLVNGGNFTYTGILQGAVFGFQFMGAAQDGDTDQIYNITSGQSGTAFANCTTSPTGNSCSTPVTFVMTGNPFELETFSSNEKNYTNGQTDGNGYNYSIIVLPPVPAQPIMFQQYNSVNASTGSLVVSTSQFSQEYGSSMTGCLLHYGPTPYQPSNIPTTLNSSTSLQPAAVGYFGMAQNTTSVISPACFSNPPNATVAYDYHFSCYNGNGQSPEVILYSVALPAFNTSNCPSNNNAAVSHYTASALSLLVGVAGVAIATVALLA